MRRRAFIAALGSAAAWPILARAQQQERVRRIGVLIGRSEKDSDGQKQAAAFERGLRELGRLPGQNAQIDYRWETNDPGQRAAFVNELLALKPDILVANSTPYLAAAQNATRTIPIVFVAIADPVAQGFIQSLARPGGMSTGFGVEEPVMGAKWAELLKEIAPGVRSIVVIFNPDAAPFSRMFLPSIEAVLQLGRGELSISPVLNESETEQAIVAAARSPSTGLIFLPNSFLSSRREFVVGVVAKHRVPAIYSVAPFAQSGGLIAYGIDRSDLFYRAAGYVDRILKGETPANLPVQMPIKFELAINLKTAKALGLDVPPSLLARADEVIE
jgi:putative ABC transport system substrate-binding protein